METNENNEYMKVSASILDLCSKLGLQYKDIADTIDVDRLRKIEQHLKKKVKDARRI